MGKARAAEVTYKDSHAVVTSLEVAAQVDLVVVALAGSGTTLERAFEDHEVAVDPQPVLGVAGYACLQAPRLGLHHHILLEGYPCIGAVNAVIGSRYPRRLGSPCRGGTET